MTARFDRPIATADRAQNLTDTKDTLVAVAKQLDDTTPTGAAAGMIRWSSANNKWQKYNGSSWVDLSSAYAINVTTFNGQAASYYTNITARLGYTPLDKAGGTMTGALTLNAAPTVDLHAATKKYVDDADALLAPKASPQFTGVVRNIGTTHPFFIAIDAPFRTTTGVATGYTEVKDQSGSFNPSTGVFTAPVNGVYLIAASISSTTPAGVTGSGARLLINGTSDRAVFGSSSRSLIDSLSIEAGTISQIFYLSASATVSVKAEPASGGSITVEKFSGCLLF